MFQSRELNRKINRWHKRCFRVVYDDATSSFKGLLQKEDSVSLHYRNIQALAKKIFRLHKGISPKIMSDTSLLSHPLNYNIRQQPDFPTTPAISRWRFPSCRNQSIDLYYDGDFRHERVSAFYGTKSLGYLGPKI